MRRDAGRSIPRWEQRAWLRWAFLAHYDEDEDFTAELDAIYERHAATLRSSPTRYRLNDPAGFTREAADLAGRFGLDRLPEGTHLVERWCWSRVRWESYGHRSRMPFTSVAGAGGAAGEPQVTAELTLRWDPASESWREAAPRLRREAGQAVAKLKAAGATAVQDAGQVFVHAREQASRDARLLFLKCRYDLDWADLAAAWSTESGEPYGPTDADAIARAVIRIATEIGVSRQGWSNWPLGH